MVPGKVVLEAKVVQVSAGDSHTAALTDDGTVYIWGLFKVSEPLCYAYAILLPPATWSSCLVN